MLSYMVSEIVWHTLTHVMMPCTLYLPCQPFACWVLDVEVQIGARCTASGRGKAQLLAPAPLPPGTVSTRSRIAVGL